VRVLENAPCDVYIGGSRRASQLAGMWVNGVQVLTLLEQQFEIVLTSSTDFDYYATYHPSVETYLRAAGFTDTAYSLECTVVRDEDNMIYVDEHQCANTYELDSEAVMILERDNVQIVLRKDAEFYRTVFESIPVDFYYRYLWKSSPDCAGREHIQPIFNALFAVAHAAQRCTKQQ
jgi:hypothetical protein